MFVNDAINFLNDIKINLQRTMKHFPVRTRDDYLCQDFLTVSSKNE